MFWWLTALHQNLVLGVTVLELISKLRDRPQYQLSSEPPQISVSGTGAAVRSLYILQLDGVSSSNINEPKMDSSVLVFLKCMDGSIWTQLNGTYGSIQSNIRFLTQSASTRVPQSGKSVVPQLLCKKSNTTSDILNVSTITTSGCVKKI